MDGVEPPKAGFYQYHCHAIRALRLGEWATAELALNAMMMEYQKIEGHSKEYCHDITKLFYAADFMRLADLIEYEAPIRFVTK